MYGYHSIPLYGCSLIPIYGCLFYDTAVISIHRLSVICIACIFMYGTVFHIRINLPFLCRLKMTTLSDIIAYTTIPVSINVGITNGDRDFSSN